MSRIVDVHHPTLRKDLLAEALSAFFRLREQKERHEGGHPWIGTAGTSPFGAHGFNPEGIRIGQAKSRHGRAVKVWDAREYRNFDDTVALGTRNRKFALRRLRRFAREGAADQLDPDGTISATARNAGMLDLKLVPERRNAVKVLLFLDVGGSMDGRIRICEELFSAARSEFRHLERMFALTMEDLDAAIRELRRPLLRSASALSAPAPDGPQPAAP